MFEKASRLKLRFPSMKGWLTVEDLWDLPLTSKNGASLDDTAKDLYRQVKETGEISFVTPATPKNTELTLALDIVKHIIESRQAENKDRLDAVAAKDRKEKILAILAKKQDAALEDMSEEELKAMIK